MLAYGQVKKEKVCFFLAIVAASMNDGILQNLLKSVSVSISDFIHSSLFI